MYERVVVGTDGSETAGKAVRQAADLARTTGATLHVVTAYRTGGPGMGEFSGAALAETGTDRALRQEAALQIAQRAASECGEGITVEATAVAGDPADALLDAAAQLEADLIVVGSKGMHGARRVLGSVPNSVCHGAECSVLVVKTDP